MVFFQSRAITLLDSSLSITFDSLLLPNLEFDNLMMAVVKVSDDESYFATVRLVRRGVGRSCVWQVNTIVKPAVSKLTFTESASTALTVTCNPTNNYITTNIHTEPIVLSPGSSHHISEDIIVRLLLRSSLYEPEAEDLQDPPMPDRYHVLSLYAPPDTDNRDNEGRSGQAELDRHHADLFRLMRVKYADCFLRPLSTGRHVANESGTKQCNMLRHWIRHLGAGVWNALEATLLSHFNN